MDDDPWISWKMAQIALIEAVTRKAGRSDCDTKCSAGPVSVPVIFSLFLFFFFSRRSDVVTGGVRARGEAKTCRVSLLAKSTAN